MVGKRQQKSKQKQLMGNHQKCWIWGKHVVAQTLEAGNWAIAELIVSEELSEQQRTAISTLAEARQLPLSIEPATRLTQLCGAKEHQGYLAKMPLFPYYTEEEIWERQLAQPLFLLLDGIQDPYNFGAILRSAEVLGVDAVFVGETHQAAVNSLVVRSSAGAVNTIPIVQVENLIELANRFQKKNITIVAATEKATTPVFNHNFCQPTAIVIGNEGNGIQPKLLTHCNQHLCIPMTGEVESLNAAVSAGILLYEVSRQRNTMGE